MTASFRARGALAVLAIVGTMLGCAPPSVVPGSQSAVTLYIAGRVVGTPDGTRIEGFHISPLDGAGRITFDEGGTEFRVSSTGGSRSDPVAAAPFLAGIAPAQDLDILGTGPIELSVRAVQGATPILVEDGYGNALPLDALTIAFEIPARGEANLFDDALVTVPMAGNTWAVAQARLNAVPAGTKVTVGFSVAGGTLTDSVETGLAQTDVALVDFGSSAIAQSTSITVRLESLTATGGADAVPDGGEHVGVAQSPIR